MSVPGVTDLVVIESTLTEHGQMRAGTKPRLDVAHDRAVVVDVEGGRVG